MAVKQFELPELYATAAQATINSRCGPGFLHDARGSLQALLSAFELLGRSAKLGGDAVRVAKACDLARRAIISHEKSTMETLELLTLQQTEAVAVDVGLLVQEVVHFLRNEAATKEVTVKVSNVLELNVSTERGKLKTLLIGLLTVALDRTSAGSALHVTVGRHEGDALVSIASATGYGSMLMPDEIIIQPVSHLSSEELTMSFARHFLTTHGGRLELTADEVPYGALTLYYPTLQPVELSENYLPRQEVTVLSADASLTPP